MKRCFGPILLTTIACFRQGNRRDLYRGDLPVVGYSIDDAVVVFDRLRENMMERKPRAPAELRTLVNDELNTPCSRLTKL